MKIRLRRKEVEELTLTEFCELYNLDEKEVVSFAEKSDMCIEEAIVWKFKPNFWINILGEVVDPEE